MLKKTLLLFSVLFLIQGLWGKKLTVILNDLPKGTKGDLMLLLVDSEKVYNIKDSKKQSKSAVLQLILKDALLSKKEVQFSIDLPAGNYVVQYYLDKNKNGKLDTGMFGIPKEKFGFTRKYSGLGKPKYEDVVISLEKDKKINLFTKNR